MPSTRMPIPSTSTRTYLHEHTQTHKHTETEQHISLPRYVSIITWPPPLLQEGTSTSGRHRPHSCVQLITFRWRKPHLLSIVLDTARCSNNHAPHMSDKRINRLASAMGARRSIIAFKACVAIKTNNTESCGTCRKHEINACSLFCWSVLSMQHIHSCWACARDKRCNGLSDCCKAREQRFRV